MRLGQPACNQVGHDSQNRGRTEGGRRLAVDGPVGDVRRQVGTQTGPDDVRQDSGQRPVWRPIDEVRHYDGVLLEDSHRLVVGQSEAGGGKVGGGCFTRTGPWSASPASTSIP